MGYQRSMWRSLAGGGGGGVAVVRCSCSEEKVRISFRSAGDNRQLRRAFVRRWFESPRLSIASFSSDERTPSATPSDSSDLTLAGQRPVSLISTVSSGSGSSREDYLAPTRVSEGSSSINLNQNLSPEKKGRSFIHNKNSNNKVCTPIRALSRREQASPFIAATMAPNPQLTYLDRVIMEIIETERMYVRDLRMIVDDYLAHIIDESDLSNHPELVCALFGNIEDIYEFNSELLQDLEMCDNDPVAIARCFVMKSEDFDIYTQYCTNYPNSVAALTECMRNKSLGKFFRDRQASLKRSLPLGSYLLKPVQRILKYHLLLQEIAKHFDPEEEGYEVVEEAIYTMTGVAWYINDMKRKHEHAVRLQEVQSLLLNWKGQDLTTYGELVLEGSFKVPRARHERTLFLFDRMLLITKRRGEHYVYKTHISSSTLLLIESAKDSLSFSVSHYKHLKQPHTVQAKTVEEKKLWAHHIKRIILENHPAAIPQKAKEAILEMDSICPPRYRYSPERLKKAVTEEFPREARQGRRQSEPTKQMLKRTKAPLEHANSEDLSLDDRRSLQGAISSSTLGSSSLGESDVDVLVHEEDFTSRGCSLERLVCSEEELEAETGRLDEFLIADEQDAEQGGIISIKENGQHSEDELNGPEPTPSQQSTHNLPLETPLEKTKEPEPEPSSDPAPSMIPETSQMSEDLKPDEEPDHVELPSSATVNSDAKTLSSGESSEEEEDEREAADKESSSPSILPSSVLDKASAIAQHFSNTMKRGSLAQDDARSLGCPSPRLPSRTGSMLSLRSESADRPLRLNSNSSDPPEAPCGADFSLLSPRDDSLFDPDRSLRRRRDSTLSKQDQLLIGKIKNYYEKAGNQDGAFGLRRRESLTYIPSGLVRSSVSRFNSIPRDETVQSNPLSTDLHPAPHTESKGHMVSSHSLDSLKSDELSNDFEEQRSSRSQSTYDDLSEEEFRPSSEMIKVWQGMERQMSRSQSEDRESNRSRGSPEPSRAASITSFTWAKTCDPECGASDLSTITEDSTSPSPPKTKTSRLSQTGGQTNTLRCFGEETMTLRATVPRVAQLKAEASGEKPAEDSEQTDEVNRAESKVLLLARRYSQQIRSTSPVVRQRGPAGLSSKSLACVVEEKESSGKPNLTLPLVSKSPSTSLPLSPVDPVQSPTACRSPGQPSSRSPLSPLPPIEGFSWPDVRELRSRYSNSGRSLKSPMSRSSTIPERMLVGGLRRHSSGSSSHLHSDEGSSGVSLRKSRGSRAAGKEERSKRLQRANSLDPRLSLPQMSELQRLQNQASNDIEDGYYIAGEAPLTDDPEHKIIIMEKLPEHDKKANKSTGEDDDGYVQIRSPTSREKISIMAVIERCRAYQESDDYKQREEAKTKNEPTKPHESIKTPGASLEQHESQKTRSGSGQKVESGQKNIVKNLREKFQSKC
ncbi:pleckstrin homology domain-containing family G member 3-like isoform X3 [Girardinichthys multiradiatus]|uniref:pleckstrin homology domain-containing family G member 3-like isoform X3 n=1 Tax=Girardinichthys multiradiatus TaxID=208333 RepID=UPI001FAD8150|nr:pleckstrin homology domain-containing family G member 3-like isoform X3 [Girardinichthys multiradiatus]